ncbi:hypothetical protein HBB16_05085 [Pseudonocardia sp. MCCB 268]|nr:hypothetical protein [Pseudonocardia cytotoxica]
MGVPVRLAARWRCTGCQPHPSVPRSPLAGRIERLSRSASRRWIETAPELTCPWLGIYSRRRTAPRSTGAGGAAEKSGVATDVVVYPRSTGYRFDDDPDSAAEAWAWVLNWFDSHSR